MTAMSKDKQHSQMDWHSWAKSMILLGMGIYMAFLILTGQLANYINLRFAWLAYLAAGVFFLLGLVSLHHLLNSAEHHHHSHITRGMLATVAFPLLLAVLIPSRPLGAEAVNGGISLRPVGVGSPAAFARNPLDRNVLDWLREFDRVQNPAALNSQPVDVIGFVYREPNFAADDFMAARFTISCCVADAYPIGLPVRFEGAQSFATGGWVRVQGKFTAGQFGADFVPIVHASRIDAVDEPAQPYLYP